jgi:glutamine amidotransferase
MALREIVVVDYGMGNLRSVKQALLHVAPANTRISVSENAEQIANADAIVFPGQGAAKACMKALNNIEGLREAVLESANSKPFLGICMGMQVLMTHSQENDGTDCLNLLAGDVTAFANQPNWKPEHKIPQMGWNQIKQTQAHPLWHGIEDASRFYFVHSYFVTPENKALIAGETDFGLNYCSAIAQDSLFAIQAHPEKSSDAGLQLLRNFCAWNGKSC